jgi:ADP-heptose:LPS heptosyltransferase
MANREHGTSGGRAVKWVAGARKLLVCLRYGIGDVVMELPALHALRQACRKAWITALGASPALQVLEGDWRVDRLECVHAWGLNHWGDDGSPAIRQGFSDWLRSEGFDLLLDPSHAVSGIRSEIVASGADVLDTGAGVHERSLRSSAGGDRAIKGAIMEGWGLRVPLGLLPELSLRPSERAFAVSFLKKARIGRGPFLTFSPVASSPLKRWPTENLAWVMDGLLEATGGRAVLLCGPQTDSASELLKAMRQRSRVTVVGSIHLRLVGALLDRTALFVCNDTGLMHLAAAVSTPVLALFGPTSPRIYRPPSGHAVAVEAGDDGCPVRRTNAFGPSECLVIGRCMRDDRGCIGAIDPEAVLSTALDMLAGSIGQERAHYGKESA